MNAAIWSGHAKTGMVEELAKRRHLQAVLIGVRAELENLDHHLECRMR